MRHTLIVAGLLGALMVPVTVSAPVLGAEADAVEVRVTETADGGFAVTGGFTVEAEDRFAWQVLTDYDQMGAFLPAMRSSVLKRSGANALTVAQETTVRFFAISKTTRVVLQVQEQPNTRIEFTDVAQRDFERYRGAWRVQRSGERTRVAYEADTKPRFVPPIGGKVLVQDTVETLLRDLRREVVRRQQAAGSAGSDSLRKSS